MDIITPQKRKEPETKQVPVVTFTPPPPAGSMDELIETALVVGFPYAYGCTGHDVETSVRDVFVARFMREE